MKNQNQENQSLIHLSENFNNCPLDQTQGTATYYLLPNGWTGSGFGTWSVMEDEDPNSGYPPCNLPGSVTLPNGNPSLVYYDGQPGNDEVNLPGISTLGNSNVKLLFNSFKKDNSQVIVLGKYQTTTAIGAFLILAPFAPSNTWVNNTITLPAACCNQPYLHLTLWATGDGTGQFICIDDLVIA